MMLALMLHHFNITVSFLCRIHTQTRGMREHNFIVSFGVFVTVWKLSLYRVQYIYIFSLYFKGGNEKRYVLVFYIRLTLRNRLENMFNNWCCDTSFQNRLFAPRSTLHQKHTTKLLNHFSRNVLLSTRYSLFSLLNMELAFSFFVYSVFFLTLIIPSILNFTCMS